MSAAFENDIVNSLEVLKKGGTILYPTDTVWGIGGDATNADAVKKIHAIKQRADSKTMIILVGDERDILKYVAAPDLAVFDFLREQTRPTTMIFNGAIGLPDNLIAEDGSIAIRIVQDEFCRHLIKRFRKPVVSTSANISRHQTPKFFSQISQHIKQSVNYVVQWRQDDMTLAQPSQIIRWNKDGSYEVIRK
jgi:L-threonylcarbamoyladenylate synthase